MIWGIDGLHAWTPPRAEEPAIVLNRLFDDEGDPVWPRFKLRRVAGLMSVPDAEDNRDAPPGRRLEITRLSQRRGKTVTYEGDIIARTLVELREAEAAFRAAFAEIDIEGRMDVYPHPLNTVFGEEPPKFYEARALIADVVDTQDTTRFSRPFVVGLRMGDGRYFDEGASAHEASIAETSTPGDFT